MTIESGIMLIKEKFEDYNSLHVIPLMNAGKTFDARMVPEGITVSNLRTQPLLKWDVFRAALEILIDNGVGVPVFKGVAMKGKLGDDLLPENSIEGNVARKVFGKGEGSTVFRRISPLSGILVYCGLCSHQPGGYLLLLDI